MSIVHPFRALFLCLSLSALGTTAAAQNFDGCGTVAPGVTCPKLFQPDSGGLYVLVYDMTPYQVGDRLHVVGTIDPGCITICQQGNGCINPTLVEGCTPATDLCFGDGTQGSCPCTNNGAPGHGCANSATAAGALLTVTGTTSPDTVVLTSAGERPTSLSIFLQGSGALGVPVPFGDGLRCVAGTLKRLYVKNAVGGVVSAPAAGDPSITARSAALGDPIAPGTSRHYQVYFRDPVSTFCPNPPGDNFNATNGKSILW
jgi:hypothetical protein